MSLEATRNYYENFAEREWLRLENPDDGAVEFAVNRHFLEKHLEPESRVLDIGGGPGRYAIWLAQHGHRVVLADLSAKLLQIAREKIEKAGINDHIDEIVETDVCDLSHWGAEYFDAVVCLGPYYHLPDPDDRETATREIHRVLRTRGLLFAALMPRLAFLQRTLAIPDERHRLMNPHFISRVLEEGIFENDIPGRFTSGYGFRPPDTNSFFASHGFFKIGLYSSEGISIGIQRSLHEMAEDDPKLYQSAMELIIRTADDPSILGMATHLLYIGRKE